METVEIAIKNDEGYVDAEVMAYRVKEIQKQLAMANVHAAASDSLRALYHSLEASSMCEALLHDLKGCL